MQIFQGIPLLGFFFGKILSDHSQILSYKLLKHLTRPYYGFNMSKEPLFGFTDIAATKCTGQNMHFHSTIATMSQLVRKINANPYFSSHLVFGKNPYFTSPFVHIRRESVLHLPKINPYLHYFTMTQWRKLVLLTALTESKHRRDVFTDKSRDITTRENQLIIEGTIT